MPPDYLRGSASPHDANIGKKACFIPEILADIERARSLARHRVVEEERKSDYKG